MAVKTPNVADEVLDQQAKKSADFAKVDAKLKDAGRQLKDLSIAEAKKVKRADLDKIKREDDEANEALRKAHDQKQSLARRKAEALGVGSSQVATSNAGVQAHCTSTKEAELWDKQCTKAIEEEGKTTADKKNDRLAKLQTLQAEQLLILANYNEREPISIPETFTTGNSTIANQKAAEKRSLQEQLRETQRQLKSQVSANAMKDTTIQNLQDGLTSARSAHTVLASRIATLSKDLADEKAAHTDTKNIVQRLEAKIDKMKSLFENGRIARLGRWERQKSFRDHSGGWVHIEARGKPILERIHDRNHVLYRGDVVSDITAYNYSSEKMTQFQRLQFLEEFEKVYDIAMDDVGPSDVLISILNACGTMYNCYYKTKYTHNKTKDEEFEGLFEKCKDAWTKVMKENSGDKEAAAKAFDKLACMRKHLNEMELIVE